MTYTKRGSQISKFERSLIDLMKKVKSEPSPIPNKESEISKCIDKAIMRCHVLILSAQQPATTEVYLLRDLLEAKALLESNL